MEQKVHLEQLTRKKKNKINKVITSKAMQKKSYQLNYYTG